MPLEREIMRTIGFDQEPKSYPIEGRRTIRQSAVSRLAAAINDQHVAGAAIATTYEPLIGLAREVANTEDNANLNKTWGICYEIILTHMMASYRQGADRTKFFKDRTDELRRYYVQPPRGGSYCF